MYILSTGKTGTAESFLVVMHNTIRRTHHNEMESTNYKETFKISKIISSCMTRTFQKKNSNAQLIEVINYRKQKCHIPEPEHIV